MYFLIHNKEENLTKKILGIAFAAILGISPAFAAGVSFSTAPGTVTDSVDWSQLGADGTLLGQNFSAISVAGVNVSGSFAGAGGGLTSVVCAAVTPTNCSWNPPSTGYNAGDTLIWAEDTGFSGTGPIDLSFAGQYGAGAYIQTTSAGQFSGQLDVYNGNVLLGSQAYTSDANGDPLFMGASSDLPNITHEVFTVSACGSFGCDPNDFSMNTLDFATPEPSTFLLAGSLLALMFCMPRRIAGFRRKV
jgi:hypothetical protein